jgi:hypothetical protein
VGCRISTREPYDTKIIKLEVGRGVWTYTESIARNVELWSELKTNRWPSYGIMTM